MVRSFRFGCAPPNRSTFDADRFAISLRSRPFSDKKFRDLLSDSLPFQIDPIAPDAGAARRLLSPARDSEKLAASFDLPPLIGSDKIPLVNQCFSRFCSATPRIMPSNPATAFPAEFSLSRSVFLFLQTNPAK